MNYNINTFVKGYPLRRRRWRVACDGVGKAAVFTLAVFVVVTTTITTRSPPTENGKHACRVHDGHADYGRQSHLRRSRRTHHLRAIFNSRCRQPYGVGEGQVREFAPR